MLRLKFIRFVRIDESHNDLSVDLCIETAASHREQTERLRAAVDRLPEKLRTVLTLAEFSEISFESIAQVLSIPAGTVASRRHLAVRKLRIRAR
jgi:RNA polymerase sigma-70 factor, ECF subfamily